MFFNMACAVASFWTLPFRNQAIFLVSKFRAYSAQVVTAETSNVESEEGDGMRQQNITGRRVGYLRSQKKWTHKTLAAKLQCQGVDISRLSLARMEWGVTKISDTVLAGLQKVFGLPIIRFFPQEVQDSDADFAKRIPTPLPDPDPPKTPRRKCQKLTKRPKKV
jgi:transcriptional regulator with XRE-family HTH domain